MYQWADKDLHRVKRTLSVFEKATLPTILGRALVMPGEPETEIDELVARGYDQGAVHGIEADQTRASQLYDHYFDLSPIHEDEVGWWLSQCKGKFSYIHLDFCGHVKTKELHAIQATAGTLDAVARLRISSYGSRKDDRQKKYEYDLLHDHLVEILRRLPSLDARNTALATRVGELIRLISDNASDTTLLHGMCVYINQTMGMSLDQLHDYVTTTPGIPMQVKGTHAIGRVTKRFYLTRSQVMYTSWYDLYPVNNLVSREWLVNDLCNFVDFLTRETPEFVPITIAN